ncbi:unnamed protein product [Effrenium voratum]|uniref:Acyl carrier protein n=1 Tax=Effrenium voratum TaxID=2562239 RepID=A0AA36IHE8_9DINO|nr:unnamed protein product [Effrenium voratum]CAJ1386374.1 unnamed protein product [Effrenium voratum]
MAARILQPALRQFSFARASPALRGLPGGLPCRWFSTGSAELQRVIAAVERYKMARKDDLLRDADSPTADREETLKALDSAITGETKWDELKFDDIDRVEVLLEVEDEFNHVIPDADADKISSVPDIMEYLDKNGVK